MEHASGQGEPVLEASSFPSPPVTSSSWFSPVMEGLPLCLRAHAHHSCLQVPLLITARPQRNRAVLVRPAALSAVPASHAGTCSGHFLLPASVAATLGVSLVFLPSYPLASPLSLKLCAVTFFLLLPFRSVVSSIHLILADYHLLEWSFLKQNCCCYCC